MFISNPMSGEVNELKKLINELAMELKEINNKIDKVLNYIDDLELFNRNLRYLISILLNEQVRKAREELRKLNL